MRNPSIYSRIPASYGHPRRVAAGVHPARTLATILALAALTVPVQVGAVTPTRTRTATPTRTRTATRTPTPTVTATPRLDHIVLSPTTVTRDVGETQSFARVVVIEAGQIVEDAPPDVLAAQPESRYRALLDAEAAVHTGFWESAAWRRLWLEDGQVREAHRPDASNIGAV